MTEHDAQSSHISLRRVVHDLETQQRRNGWLLTAFMLGLVLFFRWLNEGPYAGNSIYTLLALLILAIRGADQQLARTVSRLVALLADTDVPRAQHDA